jgi:hypothetical protein
MAKKLKTQLDVDSTKAIRSTKQASRELQKYGKTGKDATDKTSKGMKDTGSATDEMASKLGLGSKAFSSWKLAGVAAAGAVALAMVSVIKEMQKVGEEQITLAKQSADLIRSQRNTSLADVLEVSRTEALKGTFKSAAQFDISRQDASDIQFQVASVINRRKNPEKFANAERIAGQFSGITGASGETSGQLVGTALIAGLDPELFARQAQLTAKGSKLNANQLVTMLNELTPLANSNGISLVWLRNKLGALSNVITEPSKLKTTMERLIRNAAVGSEKLRELGFDVDNLGAEELISAQVSVISQKAKLGPVALRKFAIDELKLPGEALQDLQKLSGPLLAQKEREINELVSTAAPGQIQKQFDSPEFNDVSRRLNREVLETEQVKIFGRGVAGANTATALQRGKRKFQEQIAADEGSAVFAQATDSIPFFGTSVRERVLAVDAIKADLQRIINDPNSTQADAAEAKRLLDPLGVDSGFGALLNPGKVTIEGAQGALFESTGLGPRRTALGAAAKFVAVQINNTQIGNGESTADRTGGASE